MKIRTAGTPLNKELNLLTSAGTFHAESFADDNHIGIQTKFVSNDDSKNNYPSVNLELDKNGNLNVIIHDEKDIKSIIVYKE